jgi:hypothetical protein
MRSFLTSGKPVDNLRRSGGRKVGLSPALTFMPPALFRNTLRFTQEYGSFYLPISTARYAFSPLLFCYFSPLSTGPINTTTSIYK